MNDLANTFTQRQVVHKPMNKMGRILLEGGKVSLEDLKAIVTYQEQHGLRFGDAAQQLGLVTAEDIHAVLADQFSYTRTPDRTSKLDKRLFAAFHGAWWPFRPVGCSESPVALGSATTTNQRVAGQS